ncbi:MAG: tetratricopeptide repeat protein [Gemmatimonadetes bacterium]|nr:tetratricopeptide repeat protein [Gemmatimonadota bacterium]
MRRIARPSPPSPRLVRSSFLALLALAWACGGAPDAASDEASTEPADVAFAPLPEGAVTRSLLGEPLFPADIPAETRAVYEANLEAAFADYTAAPEEADAIIWYGRRLAYLGRYAEAIEIYSQGMVLHPGDARMYRHRGHRRISIRDLDGAIDDFLAGVERIRGTEDEVEPDGLPNARGIPTSTLHFNIWYHLGLAHYLQGDFERALLAWNDCLAVSNNPDAVVATTYWLHNALRRLGLDDQADLLLSEITADMDIIENTAYHDVLLLHKGEKTAEELAGPMGDDATLSSTTTSYGVAVWHLVNGRRDTAYGMFESILENGGQWAAFGYVAAEAEMARLEAEGG